MKVADKSYFTNADRSSLVEEGSADAAYLVVGKGSEVTPEMEKKYGIKGEEQEEPQEIPGIVTTANPEGGQGFVPAEDAIKAGIVVTGARDEEAEARAQTGETEPAELKGRLPEDFPHYRELADAGITSYGKLRSLKGDYSEIAGIGPKKGEEIDEALAGSAEE